mmetsp:Transcript_113402/g.366860  ORF Transcript_113402/g.366860 Transcript_113402/m.366860 type:complete len:260 (+) Transcript_113402:919-1698(+)
MSAGSHGFAAAPASSSSGRQRQRRFGEAAGGSSSEVRAPPMSGGRTKEAEVEARVVAADGSLVLAAENAIDDDDPGLHANPPNSNVGASPKAHSASGAEEAAAQRTVSATPGLCRPVVSPVAELSKTNVVRPSSALRHGAAAVGDAGPVPSPCGHVSPLSEARKMSASWPRWPSASATSSSSCSQRAAQVSACALSIEGSHCPSKSTTSFTWLPDRTVMLPEAGPCSIEVAPGMLSEQLTRSSMASRARQFRLRSSRRR